VEVIIVNNSTQIEDETTYLLKSEANKKQLLESMPTARCAHENVKQGKIVSINLENDEKNQWN